jgi:DNA-binding CsgD family transcriptional regulator
VLEEGVREAFGRRDLRGLAAMFHLAANVLDGQGRFDQAIREIDHAMDLAFADPEAGALLQSIRGSLLAGAGQTGAASESVRAARALATESGSHDLPTEMYCQVTEWCLLTEADDAPGRQLIGRLEQAADDAGSLFMISWLVPHLYATGKLRDAHAWVRTLRLKAEAAGHRFRLGDAAAFAAAEAAIAGPAPRVVPRVSSRNWLAQWRLGALALWEESSGYHGAGGERAMATLTEVGSQVRRVVLGSPQPFEICARALRDPDVEYEADPPDSVTLWNLASILATAEAVAIAGRQASASAWNRWLGDHLAEGVRSSLEWPVSADRVRGLVALRAGDPAAAHRWIDRGATWASEEGHRIEAGICRTQLAELRASGLTRGHGESWRRLRAEGWSTLREMRLEPAAHAHVIQRCIRAMRDPSHPPRLSPREAEVLRLFGNGATYWEAAQELGLRMLTVQTLAHRIYEKLEVRGKLEAVRLARELRIL